MTCLVCHGVRVDLTHVLAAVLLLDLSDVQVEGGEEVARDGDAPVVRDDGVVDRLDRLRVGLHPSDLSCEQSVGSCSCTRADPPGRIIMPYLCNLLELIMLPCLM